MEARAPSKRESQIDTLRGLAIFTMVAANMMPTMLRAPHLMALRIYGSFAAPLFIFLVGMMVALTGKRKGASIVPSLVRGSFLIIIACIMDMVMYETYPMISVDVLYLIGISLPITSLLMRFQWKVRGAIALFIFALTPVLHLLLGYQEHPADADFVVPFAQVCTMGAGIVKNWIMNGDFPLFPWLGFSILGSAAGSIRWAGDTPRTFNDRGSLVTGILLLAVGAIIWLFFPGPLYCRFGYSELFYPPTVGFIVTSLGVILSLFVLVDWKPDLKIYVPLQLFGRASLFIYIIHDLLIDILLDPVFDPQPEAIYLLLYMAFSAVLLGIAYLLSLVRPKMKKLPYPVRFIFGA